MTNQHEFLPPGAVLIHPPYFIIDGNKIKTLDDVKKIINHLGIIVKPNSCAYNDLKHLLLTDTQENN